jgi:uncharacterized membrane protein
MTAHETGEDDDAEPSRLVMIVLALVFGWAALFHPVPSRERDTGATLVVLGSLAFYVGIVGVFVTAPVDWAAITAPFRAFVATLTASVAAVVTTLGGVFVVWAALAVGGVALTVFGMKYALEGEDDG